MKKILFTISLITFMFIGIKNVEAWSVDCWYEMPNLDGETIGDIHIQYPISSSSTSNSIIFEAKNVRSDYRIEMATYDVRKITKINDDDDPNDDELYCPPVYWIYKGFTSNGCGRVGSHNYELMIDKTNDYDEWDINKKGFITYDINRSVIDNSNPPIEDENETLECYYQNTVDTFKNLSFRIKKDLSTNKLDLEATDYDGFDYGSSTTFTFYDFNELLSYLKKTSKTSYLAI